MDTPTSNTQGMDKTRKSADILKAELERRSRDLYKIYNPTNQDFEVILNQAISPEVWTIQSREEAIVPNYVRVKYLEEMSQKIITAKSDKAVVEENEKRQQKGYPAMDLHTEQFRLESRNLKNLMSKRDQVVKVLDRGLYKEYGIEKNVSRIQDVDRRTLKETFDPGDVLADARTVSSMPSPRIEEKEDLMQTDPLPEVKVAEPVVTQVPPVVVEEPDEDQPVVTQI